VSGAVQRRCDGDVPPLRFCMLREFEIVVRMRKREGAGGDMESASTGS
jgi:hypothetical protein